MLIAQRKLTGEHDVDRLIVGVFRLDILLRIAGCIALGVVCLIAAASTDPMDSNILIVAAVFFALALFFARHRPWRRRR